MAGQQTFPSGWSVAHITQSQESYGLDFTPENRTIALMVPIWARLLPKSMSCLGPTPGAPDPRGPRPERPRGVALQR
jgi:hypothetical protein